jgi:hypothetical protein
MDYYNTYEPRIQLWGAGLNSIINGKPPQTIFDFQEILSSKYSDKPIISHEIGQWCAYPNFNEIEKYKGVLQAKNLEIFQETLSNNNMGNLAQDFLMASGKLQALCYKADIEAALRTKGMAGFQLLDLHDFPGQGTALVGVLDAFWDEKGYISPESFRKFCNKTVPLARFQKRVYSNNESAKMEIEAAHFGEQELEDAVTVWRVTNKTGESIYNGVFDKQNIPLGNGYKIGNITIDLHEIQSPQKFTLEVNISDFSNTWDFWVYLAEPDKLDESEIFVTSEVDEETLEVLESGGKVLLNIKHGSLKEEKGGEIKVGFSSIFWNTAWTRNQAPHTLGILCDPEHPVFQEFPTEFHSNWQWWDLIHNSHAVILDYYSEDLNPIVRIIDDWFENRRLGLLFETKVGNGKMMISGVDFSKDLETKLGKGQFLYSIKKYMLSSEFEPKIRLKIKDIKSLLKN